MARLLSRLSLILFLLELSSYDVRAQECPPHGLDALQTVDLDIFFGEERFAQKVTLTTFTRPVTLFCQRQAYQKSRRQVQPFYCGIAPNLCFPAFEGQLLLDVFNSASFARTTGPGGGGPLRSIQKAPGAKFANGGRSSPPASYGDFFLLATGTYEDLLNEDLDVSELAGEPSSTDYAWAIFSGGLPEISTGNGCLPGVGATVNGVFTFTRDPIPPEGAIDRIIEVADFLGFDTSGFLTVEHEGCKYPEPFFFQF